MSETYNLQAPLAPAEVRYIKLGVEGGAADACLAFGKLALGFPDIPHELCAADQWEDVRAHFLANGKTSETASGHVRELREFYTLGSDTLWITFHDGRLWWAFAAPDVRWDEDLQSLPRQRRTLGPWRSVDVAGRPLLIRELSTRLTSVRAYRRTICEVKALDYLMRKLNADTDPLIAEAEAARAKLIDIANRLIPLLHEKEFELLIDLIFAQAGWRRVSVLGEAQADFDLLLEQPATGERLFVQVKSRANPGVLADYIKRFESYDDCRRMVFVCHSPTGALTAARPPEGVELWFGDDIAAKAIRAGLFDWLIARIR